MISILLVVNNEKNLKKVKNINNDDLYKKCGFKTNENFEKIYEKDVENVLYQYWSKKHGKDIYKYQIDGITYYNKLLIIKIKNNEFQNITEEDYNIIFNNQNINSIETIQSINDNKDLEIDNISELSEESYIFSSDEEN